LKKISLYLSNKKFWVRNKLTLTIQTQLNPFFFPRSIAVVGVSKNPAGVGTCMVRALQRFGFKGNIYPVNPKMDELLGLKVFPSISSIPGDIDFARLYVPSAAVLETIKECKQKNIPAVEIFTGGFSEIGTEEGKRLETELAACAGNGLRLIGPNCFGVYSPAGGVTQIPGENYQKESGKLGFLSQSGGLSEDIFRYAVDYGLRFTHGVSYGNAVDVNEVDLLKYFEADPNTRIVSGYLEGVKNGKEFISVIKSLALKKPLIIWKGGLTPSGSRVAASHTGSLAGSEKVWSAIFQQTGAVRVDTLDELLDTASAFYHLPQQTDPKVALICGGGGVGVAFGDACYREGLLMAELTRDIKNKISSFLAPLGTSSNNPIDVGPPFPAGDNLEKIMDILASSGQVGSIILEKVFPSVNSRKILGYTDQMSWKDDPSISEIPVKIAQKYRIPVIMVLRDGGEKPGNLSWEKERRQLRDYYLENNVGIYPTTDRALRSLGRMIRYYRRRQDIINEKD
jgi:acyl-CoA synthetase (NDP forming)